MPNTVGSEARIAPEQKTLFSAFSLLFVLRIDPFDAVHAGLPCVVIALRVPVIWKALSTEAIIIFGFQKVVEDCFGPYSSKGPIRMRNSND